MSVGNTYVMCVQKWDAMSTSKIAIPFILLRAGGFRMQADKSAADLGCVKYQWYAEAIIFIITSKTALL